VARRATIINQERTRGGPVLVLDSGNALTGDQDPAKGTHGQSSVTIMNLMGYDAMTLGSQDLSLGVQTLRQRVKEADFAVVAANAVVSGTKEPLVPAYLVRQLGEYRIGIIGLAGESETPEIALLDPIKTTQAVVAEVTPQADVVILLSHAGMHIDQRIADTVAGIDLILSAGRREFEVPWLSGKTGTLILHADTSSPGHAGRRIGIARLSFDVEGHLLQHRWQQLALGPDILDDPAMTQWVLANR
jgi:2',3'-cyclic-nucleotide 2'-phosphodiesterase (5'-nucleotidase family)